jgi:hypothetical protein
MSHVTDSGTCYEWVFKCAGCGLLASSRRSDATTCSTACRVRAHRSGATAARTRLAEMLAIVNERTGRPNPALMGHADAIYVLRPDLAERVYAGELTAYQAMPETYRTWVAQVFRDLAAERATTPAPAGPPALEGKP